MPPPPLLIVRSICSFSYISGKESPVHKTAKYKIWRQRQKIRLKHIIITVITMVIFRGPTMELWGTWDPPPEGITWQNIIYNILNLLFSAVCVCLSKPVVSTSMFIPSNFLQMWKRNIKNAVILIYYKKIGYSMVAFVFLSI